MSNALFIAAGTPAMQKSGEENTQKKGPQTGSKAQPLGFGASRNAGQARVILSHAGQRTTTVANYKISNGNYNHSCSVYFFGESFEPEQHAVAEHDIQASPAQSCFLRKAPRQIAILATRSAGTAFFQKAVPWHLWGFY